MKCSCICSNGTSISSSPDALCSTRWQIRDLSVAEMQPENQVADPLVRSCPRDLARFPCMCISGKSERAFY